MCGGRNGSGDIFRGNGCRDVYGCDGNGNGSDGSGDVYGGHGNTDVYGGGSGSDFCIACVPAELHSFPPPGCVSLGLATALLRHYPRQALQS